MSLKINALRKEILAFKGIWQRMSAGSGRDFLARRKKGGRLAGGKKKKKGKKWGGEKKKKKGPTHSRKCCLGKRGR